MIITSGTQLKDMIKNLARKHSADSQILLRTYMTERFLERLSQSSYKNNFINKGRYAYNSYGRNTKSFYYGSRYHN